MVGLHRPDPSGEVIASSGPFGPLISFGSDPIMRVFVIALRALSCLLLFGLVATPFAQIIMRGVFNVPMGGAEEMARYMLICLCFMAGALVTLDGGQIRMEEVQGLLPERPRWLMQLLIEAAGIIVFGYLAYASAMTIKNNLNNQTATLEMPFWLFMAPLLLGTLLLTFATSVILVRTFRRGKADDKQTTLT
jgi:TRAP-type C4-dicarboxylate transport system permease small subunit